MVIHTAYPERAGGRGRDEMREGQEESEEESERGRERGRGKERGREKKRGRGRERATNNIRSNIYGEQKSPTGMQVYDQQYRQSSLATMPRSP